MEELVRPIFGSRQLISTFGLMVNQEPLKTLDSRTKSNFLTLKELLKETNGVGRMAPQTSVILV